MTSNGFMVVPAPVGGGSVAFDAAGGGAANGALIASWTHTPVGTPTGIGVGIYWFTAGDPPSDVTIVSVTYGLQAMTLERSDLDTGPDRAAIYRMAGPTAGAQTVTVTFSDAGAFGVAHSISVTGGDPVTTFSGSNGANGSSGAATVNCPSAVGELVMDAVGFDAGGPPNLAPTGGNNQRSEQSVGGLTGAGSTKAGAASVTMSWSSDTPGPWAITAASFKAA